MARIYSDKFENVVLWDNDVPARKTLNVNATDKNIAALYERIAAEILASWDSEQNIDDDRQAHQQAWDRVWDDPSLDGCYVWVEEK